MDENFVISGRQRLRRPGLVVFDVNETLSDMSVMAERFAEVGAPSHLAATWFAGLLRDGFALAASGTSAPFVELGAGLLRVQLADLSLDRRVTAAVEHIMEGFGSLELHPDVVPGTAALRELGDADDDDRDPTDIDGLPHQLDQLLRRHASHLSGTTAKCGSGGAP